MIEAMLFPHLVEKVEDFLAQMSKILSEFISSLDYGLRELCYKFLTLGEWCNKLDGTLNV